MMSLAGRAWPIRRWVCWNLPHCPCRASRGLVWRQPPIRRWVRWVRKPARPIRPACQLWPGPRPCRGRSIHSDLVCRSVALRRRSWRPPFQEWTSPDLGRSADRFHCSCQGPALGVRRRPAALEKNWNRTDPCSHPLCLILARQNLPSCRSSFRLRVCPAAAWADRAIHRFRLPRQRPVCRAGFPWVSVVPSLHPLACRQRPA